MTKEDVAEHKKVYEDIVDRLSEYSPHRMFHEIAQFHLNYQEGKRSFYKLLNRQKSENAGNCNGFAELDLALLFPLIRPEHIYVQYKVEHVLVLVKFRDKFYSFEDPYQPKVVNPYEKGTLIFPLREVVKESVGYAKAQPEIYIPKNPKLSKPKKEMDPAVASDKNNELLGIDTRGYSLMETQSPSADKKPIEPQPYLGDPEEGNPDLQLWYGMLEKRTKLEQMLHRYIDEYPDFQEVPERLKSKGVFSNDNESHGFWAYHQDGNRGYGKERRPDEYSDDEIFLMSSAALREQWLIHKINYQGAAAIVGAPHDLDHFQVVDLGNSANDEVDVARLWARPIFSEAMNFVRESGIYTNVYIDGNDEYFEYAVNKLRGFNSQRVSLEISNHAQLRYFIDHFDFERVKRLGISGKIDGLDLKPFMDFFKRQGINLIVGGGVIDFETTVVRAMGSEDEKEYVKNTFLAQYVERGGLYEEEQLKGVVDFSNSYDHFNMDVDWEVEEKIALLQRLVDKEVRFDTVIFEVFELGLPEESVLDNEEINFEESSNDIFDERMRELEKYAAHFETLYLRNPGRFPDDNEAFSEGNLEKLAQWKNRFAQLGVELIY